jgi:glycosyltransferase involved in cell wall biosynthesis
VYVGHVNCRKGVVYLLEAWSRIELPGAELLLVGNPDAAGRELLARHRGACQVVPNMPHGELHQTLAHADVFVFPSLAEGSPLVVYEAMAAGLPVITTENARAAVRHGTDGIVVPIRDVDALAGAISFMFEHPDVRLRMGREARRRIEGGFTWRHYRARLASIYRHLMERGRGPVPLQWEMP